MTKVTRLARDSSQAYVRAMQSVTVNGVELAYLEDGLACELTLYDGKAIAVELPNSVVREITYTEPAVRGDTSGKVLKPAKLGSGLQVQVPLFVATGDRIEIDTRTGEYRRRV